MRTPVTLNAIATDVVGHYGNASKSLISAYRSASKRALAATGSGYASLIERAPVPLVGDERKARLIAAERRVAKVVGDGVARTAQGADRAIEVVVGQVLKGLEGFAQRTDWTKNMFVVDTLRRVNLPAAKLSLGIASRIDDAATTLSARAKGPVSPRVAKAATKKQPAKRAGRAVAKRVRRAA